MNLDAGIANQTGRAVGKHFRAKKIVIGRDARATLPDVLLPN